MGKTTMAEEAATTKSEGASSGMARSDIVWGGIVLAAMLAMYWQVGAIFVSRWFESPAYYHCAAVPFVAGWMLWRRWDRIVQGEARASLFGLLVLLVGLLLYWVSARTGARMVAGVAFPFIVAGIVGSVYGLDKMRIVAAPIAVLFFAIPFPEHAIGMVAMPMQRISAAATGAIAPLVGLEVVREGITLDLHGFEFIVAQECSGMHSLVALLLTGFVLIELSDLDVFRRVIAIVAIVPLVLVANVLRLLVVLLLAEYLGPSFALGVVIHGFSDIIVYFAAVLTFILMIGWLYETQCKDEEVAPPSADVMEWGEQPASASDSNGDELVQSSERQHWSGDHELTPPTCYAQTAECISKAGSE